MQKRLVLPVIICACAVVLATLAYKRLRTDNSTPTIYHNASAAQPKRIVSLAPNITEILFALGLGSNIVAVSSDSDYPPEVSQRKKLGTFWQPNTEAVIAAEPDLVIGLAFAQQEAVARTLRRLGISVLTVKIETI
jgi:iron complex transport system substrate-binding protein